MKEEYLEPNLKEILPHSYTWIENLELKICDMPEAGAFHLLPVDIDDSSKDKFKINSSAVSDSLKQDIIAEAKKFAWKGSGSITLSTGSSVFTLIAKSSINTTDTQKGRQIGLDFSNLVKGKDIDHVVLCAADGINPLDMFEGLAQGLYSCATFKGKSKTPKEEIDLYPKKVSILGRKCDDHEIDIAMAFAKSSTFTRFLQDAPPNIMDSEFLASIAKKFSDQMGLKCDIKGRAELKALGMGSFLSVASGTPIDPKLITIEIEGVDTSKTLALVGKGLTFDAGGISLKTAAGMHEMKYDMSGGAAVLGTAMFLGMVKPPVNVVCLVGAVENMPGSTATRPGDIVKAMNGKTIEILNTDAEGRLVLVDVLHHAVTAYKPEMVINIATLTGAVLHSLGTTGSAMMSNDQHTADYLLNISKEVGEPFWQLPLWPEHEKEIKSDIADYKNIASSNVRAGTIIAGAFLKEFVGNTKWAHLDIAGTGWSCKATGYPTNGGSAFGLRLMGKACLNFNR
ncbi:MAG: leucyl aminopeptidase family protein [Bdellovibrionota bacterium]